MIHLRDYQLELIEGARERMRRRIKRILLQAPTGSGKTALATHMAHETASRDGVVWFICHRAELVLQTSYTFNRFGVAHGFIAAGLPYDPSQRVYICSIDTLKNRAHLLPKPKLLIWDECHHLSAAGWAKVQALFPQSFHVGLSATPCRLDGKGLDAHFDDIVLGPSVAWLMDHGHLSQYRYFAPPPPKKLAKVRKQAGEYAPGEAAEVMKEPKLIGDAIDHWRKRADGLRTVGFETSIANSQLMAAEFTQAGIPAAHLDGGTEKSERKRIITDFADGRVLVLFNVNLFGEGFDLSAIAGRDVTIDAVILRRPTMSLSLHRQQIGRALRPAPGKVAVILDHCGNKKHGMPDDEIEWTLQGAKKGGKADNNNGPPPPVTCGGCFGQVKRPLPPMCPYCKHPLVKAGKPHEVGEGELVEVTPEMRKAAAAEAAEQKRLEREQRAREEAACNSLADWVALAQRRGYDQPQRWAWKRWSVRNSKKQSAAPAA